MEFNSCIDRTWFLWCYNPEGASTTQTQKNLMDDIQNIQKTINKTKPTLKQQNLYTIIVHDTKLNQSNKVLNA